ncbi:hypothetical protein BDZ89DRAFT_636178 [Hymenopellis radicata]|nr:hypothetical protein BDZ89DRAFT_636178 [Hymenopellis radicata]
MDPQYLLPDHCIQRYHKLFIFALHNKWTVSIRPRYPWVDSIFQRCGVLLSMFRTMDGIMPAFHSELYIMAVKPSALAPHTIVTTTPIVHFYGSQP